MSVPTLPGIDAQIVTTPRLTTRVLFAGPEDGETVLFIHGNGSSATFWEEIMLALPEGFRGIAPDLRGYGGADPAQKIDATRGAGDWSEDLAALLDHFGIGRAHVVGHSLGGAIVWELMAEHPARLRTVTLVAPGSPYGFAGTKDVAGTPTHPDFAGTGGGIVNPEFVRLMSEGDRSEDNPQGSPRVVMNSFYWKPPFKPAREEDLLSSMLSEHVGEQAYPGDMTTSENWPGVAPGVWGPINALSPKYVAHKVPKLFEAQEKFRVLWVRGSDDMIVSDASFFDFGGLGAAGLLPEYPGVEVFPPQPMISQTRAVLEKYQESGGEYTEVIMEDTGHTPYIEKPDEFNQHFHAHLKGE
ncbi:MAG: alpha/beta fold hydrolase [Anaerolineales bacterium]